MKTIVSALRPLWRRTFASDISSSFYIYVPRVIRYVKPYWKLALVSIALIFMSSAVGLLAPWPFKLLIDNVLDKEPFPDFLTKATGSLLDPANRVSLLAVIAVASLIIPVMQHALTLVDNYVNTKLELSMVRDFRSDLLRHVQRLSLTHHDQKRSGMLIYVINSQGDAVARLIMTVPALAHSFLMLAGMLLIAWWLDSWLAILSLVVVPVLYYSVGYYVRHIQPKLEEALRTEAGALSIVHESLSMIRVIIAFGREDHEHRRFRDQTTRAVDARVKITVRQTLFSLVVDTTTAAGKALILGLGAYHVIQGRITKGDLLVLMWYVTQIYEPLESISNTFGSMQSVFIALKMAFGLLDKDPEIKNKPGAISIERAEGRIVFEEVGFSYTGRVDTLRDISFEVKPGQRVAIVGPTGAGKTTLMSLLPRFYEAKKGRVLLDGHDVRDLTLESLRQQISIVLQEPLLFSGSIADNIRYGRLEASMDEIMEAADSANAHDFITQLPQRYETELGERGARLSGGERQRIAVARAFIKNAPILVLDEPTSSIDSKTEAVILDALERLMERCTTFMIAHRLSTVRNANHILVLDRGQIVQQGTHDSLLEEGGLYRQLYEMQTKPVGRKTVKV
jgi:ATP-binding cassette, subfamily B, bacterial